MSELIDSTEMYLRTLYELAEEGIPPMRARIVERLNLAGPTVSQTVARMERDGLVVVTDDRHVHFTDEGLRIAVKVMRRHRLAECLLTQMIGLDLELAHVEACRWEHVMSELVAGKVDEVLKHPTHSPYGNPIPADPDVVAPRPADFRADRQALFDFAGSEGVVVGITEVVQANDWLLEQLIQHGIEPGASVQVKRDGAEIALKAAGYPAIALSGDAIHGVYVSTTKVN